MHSAYYKQVIKNEISSQDLMFWYVCILLFYGYDCLFASMQMVYFCFNYNEFIYVVFDTER